MNEHTERSRTANRIWLAFLALLVVAPLPLGANRPAAWSAMALWMSIILLAWVGFATVNQHRIVWHRNVTFAAGLMILVVVWVLISIIPTPMFSNEIWEQASVLLDRKLTSQISISTSSVIIGLMKWATYFGGFWIALQFCNDPKKAKLLIVTISLSSMGFALYGLVDYFLHNPFSQALTGITSRDAVVSVFVNRNHYAIFAGFGLICSIALAISEYRKAWDINADTHNGFARSIRSLTGLSAIYYIIAVVIGMAILQTHSRMGAFAVIIGVATLLTLGAASGSIRGYRSILIGVLVTSTFVLGISGQGTLDRIATTTLTSDRAPIFSIAVDQIRHAPLTGTGLGTFPEAFQIFRDQRLPINATFRAAHDTYLELAAEIGIPAAAAFVLVISYLSALCVRGCFMRRKGKIYPIVAASASIMIGVHSLADFGMQIPANALTFSALLGMGIAQSWSSRPQQSGQPLSSSPGAVPY